MMMAPSMMRPKSRAPRLIRFAGTPKAFIPIAAMANDNGMTSVAMMAARALPRRTNSVAITRSAPIARFSADGGDGGVDELRAIEQYVRDDAGRQIVTYLQKFFANRRCHGTAVLAGKHQGGADHDFASILARRAGAKLASDSHRSPHH